MTTKWRAALLGCMTLSAANAQIRVRPRFSVGAAQVAKTIASTFASRGILISEDQVTLPVAVAATEEFPALEVSSIQSLGRLHAEHPEQTSAGVKLKCKTRTACVPFYAVVTWQKPDGVLAGKEVNSETLLPSNDPSLPISIASGAHVTLMMEADHASIRMDVVSLESAAVGKQVRVATPDRKHFYHGVVVDAGLVKGSF